MLAIKFGRFATALSLVSLVSLFCSATPAAGAEIVKFRLTSWKSAHFDDAGSATSHLATMKKIGCEAQQQQHAGHFDVTFRCPQWRSISFQNHNEAHQWEHWLKSYGFETIHQH